MNGIEKITERIAADGAREVETIESEARAKAQEISESYARQAQRETEELLERNRKNAAERAERLKSVAQLEGRKKLLAAKQEMLEQAFDRALEKMLAMDRTEYVELLARLCAQAAQTGREEVIFSKKDRQQIGKAVVTRANELLASQVAPKLPDSITESTAGAVLNKVVKGASALLAGTGMLTLAEETRPIQGGFIMAADGVEVNCAFETLVRLQRNELERQVAQVLFGS